jgi:hypothetical protein
MSDSPTERPRVVLLTSPSLYGALIIDTLAAEPGIELVGVGLTDRVFKNKGLLATARTMIQRTGLRYTHFGVKTSNVAWIRLQLSGRPRGLKPLKQNVKYLKDVNSPETVAWLRDLAPDYVASFYFNQWIGAEVRQTAKRACVNLHPSLLPALRGPDPIFRTLERRLTQTGLTLHLVDEGFDTGHILLQEERPVPDGVSAFGLYLAQVKAGAHMLAEWLAGKRAAADRQTGIVPAADDYTTFPTPQEVRAFLKSGQRLIRPGELRRAIREVR